MTQPKRADTDAPASISQAPMNWRFEFGAYDATRHFLDLLADLSKREGYYPNINFGKTYVNVSIDAEGYTALGAGVDAFIAAMKTYAAQDPA